MDNQRNYPLSIIRYSLKMTASGHKHNGSYEELIGGS